MACEIVQNWAGSYDNKFYYCRDHKCECPSDKVCGTMAVKPAAPVPTPPPSMHVMDGPRDVCQNCGLTGQEIYYYGMRYCKHPNVPVKAWNDVDNLNLGVILRATRDIPGCLVAGRNYPINKIDRQYKEVRIQTEGGERLIHSSQLPQYFELA